MLGLLLMWRKILVPQPGRLQGLVCTWMVVAEVAAAVAAHSGKLRIRPMKESRPYSIVKLAGEVGVAVVVVVVIEGQKAAGSEEAVLVEDVSWPRVALRLPIDPSPPPPLLLLPPPRLSPPPLLLLSIELCCCNGCCC